MSKGYDSVLLEGGQEGAVEGEMVEMGEVWRDPVVCVLTGLQLQLEKCSTAALRGLTSPIPEVRLMKGCSLNILAEFVL